jgi:PII-like signaling protein
VSAGRRWIPGQARKDGKYTWQEKTMLKNGPAKKLTIYVDETEKVHGKPVYEAVLEILINRKISGASVYRGVAGYGSHGKLHTAKILELSTTLPVKIEVVDTEGMINIVLAEISSVVEKGLIEVSDTNVIKCSAGKT